MNRQTRFFLCLVLNVLWVIWGVDLVKEIPGDSHWITNLRVTAFIIPAAFICWCGAR